MEKQLKNKKTIIIIVLAVLLIILTSIFTRNIINNNLETEKYSATTANANSNLVANYIKEGITIGGITGTLKTIDISELEAILARLDTLEASYLELMETTENLESNLTSLTTRVSKIESQVRNYYGIGSTTTCQQLLDNIFVGKTVANNSGNAPSYSTGFVLNISQNSVKILLCDDDTTSIYLWTVNITNKSAKVLNSFSSIKLH